MLIYICDVCGKESPAKLLMKGLVVDGFVIEKSDSPCEECQKAAEQAKQEALERRKKKI